jgi:hypothetical protein
MLLRTRVKFLQDEDETPHGEERGTRVSNHEAIALDQTGQERLDARFFDFVALLRVFEADFFEDDRDDAVFGTLAPSRRASERPMAIACLRLVTLRPERPLFKVPALRFFIARSTSADAFVEYRAMAGLPVAGR